MTSNGCWVRWPSRGAEENDNDWYRHDVQVKDLEQLLSDAERERREVREKYVALGRRCETLQGSEEAARYGLQVSLVPACYLLLPAVIWTDCP